MRKDGERRLLLEEYHAATIQAAELEKKMALGLFEDGTALAGAGIATIDKSIGIFRVKPGLVLLVQHEKTSDEMVTFALVNDMSRQASSKVEVRGTLISFLEVTADGVFKSAGSESSELDLEAWLQREVNKAPDTPDASIANQVLELTKPQTSQTWNISTKRNDSRPRSNPMLEILRQTLAPSLVEGKKPNPEYILLVARVAGTIDPVADNITLKYVKK
jgi:hypothetical protein